MPAGFTKKTYRGALLTGATGNILTGQYLYSKNSYRFIYDVKILDVSEVRPGSLPVLRTISSPPNSFTQNTLMLDDGSASAGTGAPIVLITSPYQTASTPSTNLFTIRLVFVTGTGENNAQIGYSQVQVDQNSQLRYQYTNGDASITLRIFTDSFIENI